MPLPMTWRCRLSAAAWCARRVALSVRMRGPTGMNVRLPACLGCNHEGNSCLTGWPFATAFKGVFGRSSRCYLCKALVSVVPRHVPFLE